MITEIEWNSSDCDILLDENRCPFCFALISKTTKTERGNPFTLFTCDNKHEFVIVQIQRTQKEGEA